MSARTGVPILLLFLIVIPVFEVGVSTTVFSLLPDNIRYEVWGGFNGDAAGESYYDPVNVKFVMWINDTSGSWGLAKLSRGLMPHYWGLRYALLDNEFEIKRGLPTWDLILEIDLKLVNYANYTVSNSSTNVAIVLFFDGFKTDYQVKCYQTELQFFSYYGDNVQKNQVWFFEWRNDSVAQFKLADNLKPGEYKHYRINLIPYIQQMMDYYKLDHVKLKHVEIFTEAFKGYCEFEVYSANIHVEQSSFLHLTQLLILIELVFLLCIFIFLIFYRRKYVALFNKQSRNPKFQRLKIYLFYFSETISIKSRRCGIFSGWGCRLAWSR
ncbi:MAG: hypothetical protein N3D12_03700, partial [Candidatus Methanomethyliaceae archaeon]|nr:hypothetical protein [Candidatus Methanomethyliaceae archaeon]